jgi:hypothetical protein
MGFGAAPTPALAIELCRSPTRVGDIDRGALGVSLRSRLRSQRIRLYWPSPPIAVLHL